MSKFNSKISSVTLLLVGLLALGSGLAAEESQETSAFWNVPGCWITLEVHDPADLGTITGPGQVIESTGNPVALLTNCSEWVLNIMATDVSAPISADMVLEDFEWRVGECPPGVKCQHAYTNFSGLNQEMLVAEPKNEVHEAEFGIDYRYTSDMNDLPGDYRVDLVYTVTTP